MRNAFPLLATCLLLTGCAARDMEATPPLAGEGGTCSGEGLQAYVGRTVSAELGTELLGKSGARRLRWGPPNAAMTMDYREDRLTISYDETMKVTRISCG